MGMLVYVYRNALGDGTNGGVSSRFARLCVTNVEGPFKPDETMPAVVLHSHVNGTCLRLVPAEFACGTKRWTSFGGNYAATCDSRFTEACCKLLGHDFYGAVAIHDRVE